MRKLCKKCKQYKNQNSFRKERHTCKKCEKIYIQKWRIKNQKKIKNYTKTYYRNFKIIIDQNFKIYYFNHKNYFKLKAAKYRKKHLIKMEKQRKIYIKNNKDKINKRIKIRLLTDINFKLKKYLRNRIYNALKHNYKSLTTSTLIGCSINQLKSHLEKQFTKGMSWSNWGKGDNGHGMKEWHIDHIKPCASFDLRKKSEQLKCFNYKNLQPLWATINESKGEKQ